ncbi:hypothetical protein EYC80_004415 [Monilinia laxa]|uniref:ABC transporter domain-containing protein n=1 Tax=Monilinia laxa TaxID=61186 RepID=A0A5N6KMQ7_MONLA|nr:hypothetical protein EYC80_004415 [Monilinia laxa]
MLQIWSRRAKPNTKNSLPLALMKCLKQPFFAAVIPRLFLIAFRYSQPTLIKESINHGYLCWPSSVYQHRINRLKLMTRGALVGLIHAKTMELPSIAYDNGKATTLMSTDADSLDGIAEMVHETWAQVIEVLIVRSHMSRFVAKHLQPRQKAWNSATQRRIAATSSLISAMKVVKMIGFQHNLTHRVRQLRKEELWVASKLRWVMVYYNASANALGIFSPAITLAILAVISQAYGIKLDTTTAFPTMAILSMVNPPSKHGYDYHAAPWLPSGTIEEVIRGAKDIDGAITQDNKKWYDTVAEICCLTHDFDTLPDGDQTQIGSRDLNSVGQKQRVTLARALFARSDTLLLDDTFSGLDGDTEQTIFDNLFGSTGLMRRLKTTVILVSNSYHVVVLGDNGIIDQGNWQSIKIKVGSIAKFSSGSYAKDNATVSAAFAELSAQVRAKGEAEIDLARQSGDSALYGYYLEFVESKNLYFLIACTATYAFFVTIPQHYLQLWTVSSGRDTGGSHTISAAIWIPLTRMASTYCNECTVVMFFPNRRCLDNAQRPEFLLLCLQRWLNVVLDLLAAAVATSVIAIAVAYRDRVSGAQVGIALNIMLVANTALMKLVESWTALEISLGANARLSTLERMTPFEGSMIWNLEPAESWLSREDIEFKNITASYMSDSVALRNLSLNIISGQKIIVCRRTGSGKSTLLLTLLRLLELQSGQIVLDGINIKKVGLDILRQCCFITVSQDPLLLFNELLRFNLDPDAALSNEAFNCYVG